MSKRISNEEFLKELGISFESSKQSGSVHLSQKRLTEPNVDDTTSTAEYQVLFRVSRKPSETGKVKTKVKYSTVVSAKDLDKFWTAYTEAIKVGMGGLKKKEKKKAKKAKK